MAEAVPIDLCQKLVLGQDRELGAISVLIRRRHPRPVVARSCPVHTMQLHDMALDPHSSACHCFPRGTHRGRLAHSGSCIPAAPRVNLLAPQRGRRRSGFLANIAGGFGGNLAIILCMYFRHGPLTRKMIQACAEKCIRFRVQ